MTAAAEKTEKRFRSNKVEREAPPSTFDGSCKSEPFVDSKSSKIYSVFLFHLFDLFLMLLFFEIQAKGLRKNNTMLVSYLSPGGKANKG